MVGTSLIDDNLTGAYVSFLIGLHSTWYCDHIDAKLIVGLIKYALVD